MRLVDALTFRNTLGLPTPDDRKRARQEQRASQTARAIIQTKTEIPRSELDLEALGGRIIEHVPTGHFYRRFGGDPGFVGNDVTMYFVDAEGSPVLLQRTTTPSSRVELDRTRARREQRKADQAAAAKAQRAQLRKAAGR